MMGYGVTGKAAVQYILSCDGVPLVSDSRDQGEFARDAAELTTLGIRWEAGEHRCDFLAQADLVLLSPGISYQHPVVVALRQRGIAVYGELAILAPFLQKRGVTIVAITGSNGKTTVTSLVGEVLLKAGRQLFIGGNIGVSLYEFCQHPDDGIDIVVVEVSSFQLEAAGEFAPDIGVLLNISPDHIDRHKSFENYIDAKLTLFQWQNKTQLAIINGDNSVWCERNFKIWGRRLSFGKNQENGAIIKGDQLILVEEGVQKTLPLPKGTTGFAAENFAAAALVLRALDVDFEQIQTSFADFKRPPHRLEEVDEIDGVLYINDSKATNTGAVSGALQQQYRPVLLIAGGRDKGENYRQLCSLVEEKVRHSILIGEAAQAIGDALSGYCEISYTSSLLEAVMLAEKYAFPGDVVLLSPACASFDMFTGYVQRGECFRQGVATLRKQKEAA